MPRTHYQLGVVWQTMLIQPIPKMKFTTTLLTVLASAALTSALALPNPVAPNPNGHKYLKYGAIGRGGVPCTKKNPNLACNKPKVDSNHYHRGCESMEKCRPMAQTGEEASDVSIP
ncbi:hypothetical protein J1614_003261 [Plenodomus biglobosus]|nr:hypothetical protein J1614_003261 [Plenodomus biglobosus]